MSLMPRLVLRLGSYKAQRFDTGRTLASVWNGDGQAERGSIPYDVMLKKIEQSGK